MMPDIITEDPTKPFFLNKIDWPHKSLVLFLTDITGALVHIVF